MNKEYRSFPAFLYYSIFFIQYSSHESIISKQIIRSGTSIGANANEAVYGVSQADFIAKLQISCKFGSNIKTIGSILSLRTVKYNRE